MLHSRTRINIIALITRIDPAYQNDNLIFSDFHLYSPQKMSELAALSLFPATPDQVIASRKRTFVHWANGMTLAQYLQRDISLDAMEHAVNGNLTTW